MNSNGLVSDTQWLEEIVLKVGDVDWLVIEDLPMSLCLQLTRALGAPWKSFEECAGVDGMIDLEQMNAGPVLVDCSHVESATDLQSTLKRVRARAPHLRPIFLTRTGFRWAIADVYGRGQVIACPLQGSRSLDDSALQRFARKLAPRYTENDLVLSPMLGLRFREVLSFVRTKEFCETTWGFRRRHSRGHGVHILFHGPSGTGKTMAAEVIASSLGVPLYQVDLSTLFSKWVGETEKNLRDVFLAARGMPGVLLFDEGDSLFASRSETTTSQDRYSNLEVSFLLQALEAHDGITVMSTNLFKSVDPAFLRRFAFSLSFQPPTSGLRERIWREGVPAECPVSENVDFKHLSQFSMTGGSIRTCIREGAARAASRSAPQVTQEDFLWAVKRELQKQGLEFSREMVGDRYWPSVGPEWEGHRPRGLPLN